MESDLVTRPAAALPAIAPYPIPDAGELPANRAGWMPDPARAVLLLHDLQRYFLRAFDPAEPPLSTLLENVVALRSCCRELGIPVAYTAQPGGMSAGDRGLLQDFWGPGMSTDPEQQQVLPAVAPQAGDWVFTKWRYSAFHHSGLLQRIRDSGRDQIILCGVYAHIGILITACDAFSNDIETFLVCDAVADFGPQQHRMALDYAAQRCAVVRPTDGILAQLQAREGRP